jgi:hypothetical protein
MIRRWLHIRHLSRMQERHWVEASYINSLYSLLHITTQFREGLERVGGKG